MNILTEEKTIRRNAAIAKYATILGVGLLLLSMYFSYKFGDPQFAKDFEAYAWWMGGGLFVGFILLQVGTYFMNRFGRRPRPDELLTASLKGFTKDYTLYNYLTPVNHLLVGPAGVWIIEPYYQRGKITFRGERWHQKSDGFFMAYMKIFGQEGLGRPDLDVKADMDNLGNEFKKVFGEDIPPIHAVLVFTDPRAEIAVENAPFPTLQIKELKDYLRKYAKEHPLPAEEIRRISAVLPEEGVE